MDKITQDILKKTSLITKLTHITLIVFPIWLILLYPVIMITSLLDSEGLSVLSFLIFFMYFVVFIVVLIGIGIWLVASYSSLAKLLTAYFSESDMYGDQKITYFQIRYAYYMKKYRIILYSKTPEQLHKNMELIAKYPLDEQK